MPRYQYIRSASSILLNKTDVRITALWLATTRANLVRKHGPLEVLAKSLHSTARDALFGMATKFGRHVDIQRLCGSFNRNVAELLIIRDIDVARAVSPDLAKQKYYALRMQSHHIIESNFFAKFEKAFLALADEIDRLPSALDRGWWRSANEMPAIPLPQELHGHSSEGLKEAMRLFEIAEPKPGEAFELSQTFNFNRDLGDFVKHSESLEDLFKQHIQFYRTRMGAEWFERKLAPGGPTLLQYLEERRDLARLVDLKLAQNP
jgi:hypothetical protein